MLLGGLRIDADLKGSDPCGAPPLPRDPPPGFSPSGGGVGGKTLRLIAGGALDSLSGLRLVRFLCTRFVAAKLMLSIGRSSFAASAFCSC